MAPIRASHLVRPVIGCTRTATERYPGPTYRVPSYVNVSISRKTSCPANRRAGEGSLVPQNPSAERWMKSERICERSAYESPPSSENVRDLPHGQPGAQGAGHE
jgi:hypothetical protein